MKKGFTLIELLIVIAVLAVLSAAVVLVLNPAELLKQSRDSTRISDVSAINSAIGLYVADGLTAWTATTTCTNSGVTTFPGSGGTCFANSSTTITGNGWVNVNLTSISGGSPLSRFPTDPSTSLTACVGSPNGCSYGYRASTTATGLGKYKLVTNMESSKYSQGGPADVESTDGGTAPSWYEIGTDMSL